MPPSRARPSGDDRRHQGHLNDKSRRQGPQVGGHPELLDRLPALQRAAGMTTSMFSVRILRLSKDGLTWFIILLQKYDFFDLFRELRSSLVDYVSLGRLMGIDRDTTNYVS